MATFLLVWNPNRWEWTDLDECANEVHEFGYHIDTWSCGVTRRITEGDRLFLMRLGREPRGICASGWSESDVFEDRHWDGSERNALFVDMRMDVLLNPEREPILPLTVLSQGILAEMNWRPQGSGITIPVHVASELEIVWAHFLAERGIREHRGTILLPEEIASGQYYEGAARRIWINTFERNSSARQACLTHYGATCVVCGFDSAAIYGSSLAGIIHVHHLTPLSQLGTSYLLDPIRDLRPVCPNCHAVIHSRRPPYSLEETQRLMRR